MLKFVCFTLLLQLGFSKHVGDVVGLPDEEEEMYGKDVGKDLETRTTYLTKEEYYIVRGKVSKLAAEFAEFDRLRAGMNFFGKITSRTQKYSGQVFIFSSVLSNDIVSPYNAADGKYTCKRTGNYFVTVSIRAKDLDRQSWRTSYGKLMKEGTEMTDLKVGNVYYSNNYKMELQAATSVILPCSENQKIWFQAGNFDSYDTKTRIDQGTFAAFYVAP